MGFHSTLYFWLILTGHNTPGIERIRQWFHHPNEGMVVIVSADQASSITAKLEAAGEEVFNIGAIERGDRSVRFHGSVD